jgi:hypothetical protein
MDHSNTGLFWYSDVHCSPYSGFHMVVTRWEPKMVRYYDGRFSLKLTIRKPDLFGFQMFTVYLFCFTDLIESHYDRVCETLTLKILKSSRSSTSQGFKPRRKVAICPGNQGWNVWFLRKINLYFLLRQTGVGLMCRNSKFSLEVQSCPCFST